MIQVERTFEGVLVTFFGPAGEFVVLFETDTAIKFASTVMTVAALGAAADPRELIDLGGEGRA